MKAHGLTQPSTLSSAINGLRMDLSMSPNPDLNEVKRSTELDPEIHLACGPKSIHLIIFFHSLTICVIRYLLMNHAAALPNRALDHTMNNFGKKI